VRLGAGCWVLGTGYWVLGAGYWVLGNLNNRVLIFNSLNISG